MSTPIISVLVKQLPYIGPLISIILVILDIKHIVKNATPINATKIIIGRIRNKYMPHKWLVRGKSIINSIRQVFKNL